MVPVLINDLIHGRMKYGGEYGAYFARYEGDSCTVTMKQAGRMISPVHVEVLCGDSDAVLHGKITKAPFTLTGAGLSEADRQTVAEFFTEGFDILRVCRDVLQCRKDISYMNLTEYIQRNGLPEETTQEEADEHLLRRFAFLNGEKEEESKEEEDELHH